MTHITTLIPAYKKEYLAQVFMGLRRQSFKDFRVILSDDSEGGVITDMIRGGQFGKLTSDLNLLVVPGPKNARRNHEQLLDLWGGQSPLVHMHLDDDLIFPDFYKTHARAHAAAPCSVSVSQRWLSVDDATPAYSLPIPDFIQDCDGHMLQLSTEELFASTVAQSENWLGELSNMVMSAEGAALYPRPPINDLSYYGLLDVGMVLNASLHLPVTFIRESLSVFRQNAQQTTRTLAKTTHGGRVSFLAWVTYALAAWRDGILPASAAIQGIGLATRRMKHHFAGTSDMDAYFEVLQGNAGSLEQLYDAYRDYWLKLLASHPGTSPTQDMGTDVHQRVGQLAAALA